MLQKFNLWRSGIAREFRQWYLCASIYILILLLCHSSPAQSISKQFADPMDGKFDVSYWLLKPYGFLPVGTIITEPAIGFGVGGGLIFFHEAKSVRGPNDVNVVSGPDEAPFGGLPPSISGAFGFATDNGTSGGGGFHVGSWREDSIRYTGAIIVPSVNLTFYGGGDSPLSKDGLDYNMDGWLLFQELLFRIDQSNVFLGGRLSYSDTKSKFDIPGAPPGIDSWELDFDTLGLGFVTQYDSTDNMFTPNRGTEAELSTMVYNGSGLSGVNEEHQITTAEWSKFWPVRDDLVVGWHVAAEIGSGDIPFYALPDIDLRGIPAMRYQNTHALMTEAEVRWDFDSRWSLVGFGGVGAVAEAADEFSDSKARWAGGAGFRYLLARQLGLRAGLDIAVGPEEAVVYIQVGQAWSF
ncbi:MAG: BamA/TamA family outer membrane protein [Planctomycetota bacterium]